MRKILLSALAVFASMAAFAIPGVESYIHDQSGEYVYYQDMTFARPSYAGFLFYNDSEYALRFYAAADAKTKQDETEVEVLISIDPENEKLEFTGELVVKSAENDSEIINYLHDLFYELSERRQKVSDVQGMDDVSKNEYYPIFGGSVVMKYNALVPIFNVRSILSDAGSEQFRLVTAGALKSSSDTSFDDFKGFPEKIKDKKRKAEKPGKTKMSAEVSGGSAENPVIQNVQLDSSWSQSMQNVWIQGNAAVLSLVPFTTDVDSAMFEAMVLRNMIRSGEHSYIDLKNAQIWRKDGISVTAQFLGENGNVQLGKRVLLPSKNGWGLLNLTVFDGVYQKKKSYYDAIVKSYTVE